MEPRPYIIREVFLHIFKVEKGFLWQTGNTDMVVKHCIVCYTGKEHQVVSNTMVERVEIISYYQKNKTMFGGKKRIKISVRK